MMNTLIGIPFCAQVASSCTFIWTEPSPATQHDQPIGAADRRAHRRRQPEAHRAQPARVDPAPRLREVVVLRGPHLVLADVAGDDRLAAGRLVERLDHVLRLDLAVGAVLVAERVLRLPAVDPAPPVIEPRRCRRSSARYSTTSFASTLLRVADDRDVGRDVLGDLGRIDVDVDELRSRRELGELAGDAVVEPRARPRRSGRPRPSRSWPPACRASRACRATADRRRGEARRGPSACRSPGSGRALANSVSSSARVRR